MTAGPASTSREIEYAQLILYIHHMYDTRHQILQFVIAFNTALLALVFEYLSTDVAKGSISLLAGIITLALTLMARRSLRYLFEVERYGRNLEATLGLGFLTETSARMPRGIDSSVYPIVIYVLLIATWAVLSVHFLVRALS